MKLSIIMPAHNEEGHLARGIEELREELFKERIDFELIVVNDNSKDGTGRIADDSILVPAAVGNTRGRRWPPRQDSNLQPSESKSDALSS